MEEPPMPLYELRGNRVAHRSAEEITIAATRFCALFRVTRRTSGKMAAFIESLSTSHICVDLISDDQWLWLTDALCDPSDFTILMPNCLYEHACFGDPDAISTVFHEIGHLVLGHKAVLHNEKSSRACVEEDAEWQADLFSDKVLARMGIESSRQMTLNFGGMK